MRVIHYDLEPYTDDKHACGVQGGYDTEWRKLVTCLRCKRTKVFLEDC